MVAVKHVVLAASIVHARGIFGARFSPALRSDRLLGCALAGACSLEDPIRNSPSIHVLTSAVITAALLGCAGSTPPAGPESPADARPASLAIPSAPPVEPLARRRVAVGLNNPRGIEVLDGGQLLVSVAGTGDEQGPGTGQLLRLRDANADGDFDDADERAVLLDAQPSRNIFHVVRRDEVFGMAGIARGGDVVLVSLAFFGGPSTIFRVEGDEVTQWGSTQGNINDLAYDPTGERWVGVASTTDEVVELLEGGLSRRITKFRTRGSGQDAVPGYLRHDPVTDRLAVSLFTGSPEGEEGGDGTELVMGAGAIVVLSPQGAEDRNLVSGLSVPTDFEIASDGSIYVLEFCDAFLDPVTKRQDMLEGSMHGGFKRYSGRLLRVERPGGRVTVVAEGLDTPTNLAIGDGALFVAQGMGTPGRMIPTPGGDAPLDGFIERFDLPK